eukprot:CAMPEP_0185910400 /NCGR_PEP_ID=MMETSP0196C-20130402/19126_1 /TAXON_ID=2932 /ORGANISM="Alexandrium fundyense, Strain CCMP1719" /LENGTH=30 /DNA_ID= /DNA_START= /DNA_END= /DNA_ORIENTATION=
MRVVWPIENGRGTCLFRTQTRAQRAVTELA